MQSRVIGFRLSAVFAQSGSVTKLFLTNDIIIIIIIIIITIIIITTINSINIISLEWELKHMYVWIFFQDAMTIEISHIHHYYNKGVDYCNDSLFAKWSM